MPALQARPPLEVPLEDGDDDFCDDVLSGESDAHFGCVEILPKGIVETITLEQCVKAGDADNIEFSKDYCTCFDPNVVYDQCINEASLDVVFQALPKYNPSTAFITLKYSTIQVKKKYYTFRLL